MIYVALLAAGILSGPVEELVLRSGAVMEIGEVVTVEDGALLFLSTDGTLYSLPMSQVDVVATESRMARRVTSGDPRTERDGGSKPASEGAPSPRLPVPDQLPHSEEEKRRILAELESYSHTGSGHGRQPPRAADGREKSSDLEISVEGSGEEDEWRRTAREYEARIATLEEELGLMKRRERQLNAQLLYLSGSTGDATQYSYLVNELENLRAAIPTARRALEATRARYREFRTRARRAGVPPGWLR